MTHDPLLPDEPDATSALRAGAALVTASGDKLLGGPQAGLLLGRAGVVERLRRHPLARALRVDKLTLAALEATLRGPRSPTWEALHADPGALQARAERLCEWIADTGYEVAVAPSAAVVGGGGAPGVLLPSWAVTLPERYAPALRRAETAGHRPRRERPAAARPAVRACRARRVAAQGHRGAGRLTCTSSRPPGMWTTESPRWYGR